MESENSINIFGSINKSGNVEEESLGQIHVTVISQLKVGLLFIRKLSSMAESRHFKYVF